MYPLTITLTIASAAQFALLAPLLSGGQPATAPAPTKAPPPQPDPKAEKPAATPAPTKAPPPPPAAEKPDVLDYEVLRTAIFKLVALSPAAAGALNAEFGVKTMKDLPEGKRRDALAKCNEKIAELQGAA